MSKVAPPILETAQDLDLARHRDPRSRDRADKHRRAAPEEPERSPPCAPRRRELLCEHLDQPRLRPLPVARVSGSSRPVDFAGRRLL